MRLSTAATQPDRGAFAEFGRAPRGYRRGRRGRGTAGAVEGEALTPRAARKGRSPGRYRREVTVRPGYGGSPAPPDSLPSPRWPGRRASGPLARAPGQASRLPYDRLARAG